MKKADAEALKQGSSPLTRGKLPHVHVRVLDHGLIPAHAGKTSRSPSRRPLGEAHPRSRGENTKCRRSTLKCRGSSPLTRGKRGARHDLVDCVRLIPAHAGKTVPQGPRRSVSRAHPRSREENYAGASDVLRRNGSSPLTRGKPLAVPLVALAPRLIPAHAGKTYVGLGIG